MTTTMGLRMVGTLADIGITEGQTKPPGEILRINLHDPEVATFFNIFGGWSSLGEAHGRSSEDEDEVELHIQAFSTESVYTLGIQINGKITVTSNTDFQSTE